MSDDDDYMSDKFISDIGKHAASSLIIKRSHKRLITLTKRRATTDALSKMDGKMQCVMTERQKLIDGLSCAISPDNKGFGMIIKMGFKPGQGIGKNNSGRTELIPIDIKTDRSGLGIIKDGSSKRKERSLEEIIPELHEIRMNEFRDRVSLKKLEHLIEVDLIKSQMVCEQLDGKRHVNKPIESWYWPPVTITEKKLDEDLNDDAGDHRGGHCMKNNNNNRELFNRVDEEIRNHCDDTNEFIETSMKDKLDSITQYLREFHTYCIWCGTLYSDQVDLKLNCPGNTRADH